MTTREAEAKLETAASNFFRSPSRDTQNKLRAAKASATKAGLRKHSAYRAIRTGLHDAYDVSQSVDLTRDVWGRIIY